MKLSIWLWATVLLGLVVVAWKSCTVQAQLLTQQGDRLNIRNSLLIWHDDKNLVELLMGWARPTDADSEKTSFCISVDGMGLTCCPSEPPGCLEVCAKAMREQKVTVRLVHLPGDVERVHIQSGYWECGGGQGAFYDLYVPAKMLRGVLESGAHARTNPAPSEP